MKKVLLTVLALSLLHGSNIEAKRKYEGTLSFSVTDRREVITRNIGGNLLLRVKRARSVTQEYFGWDVEVVRKPSDANSLNLLYHSTKWHGPYPSQVYAWHVGAMLFRDERELEVRGEPCLVKIVLVDPVVEGEGWDRRFISGKIKVTWKRKSEGYAPPGNGTRPTADTQAVKYLRRLGAAG